MPSISLVHYPAIYPKFRAVCEKHGCLPTDAGPMPNAIASHWRYVYELGKGDPPPTHAPAPLAKALAADDLETGGQGDGKVGGATTGAKKVPNMPGILATPTLTASPRVLPITV